MLIKKLESANQSQKVAVFDIDGTLTTSQKYFLPLIIGRLFRQSYNIPARDKGKELVSFYAERGYQIIYLSVRPTCLKKVTKSWLKKNGFPKGIVKTAPILKCLTKKSTIKFKSKALKELINEDVDIKHAYGDMDTDIQAYTLAGFKPENIFIIRDIPCKEQAIRIKNYQERLQTLIDEEKEQARLELNSTLEDAEIEDKKIRDKVECKRLLEKFEKVTKSNSLPLVMEG